MKTLSSDPDPLAIDETWAACLIVSTRDIPVSVAEFAAKAAVSAHCKTIAIVSPNAEVVHDYVDALLESHDAFDVVTTFDGDPTGLEDALVMLDTGPAERGPVHAYSDTPDLIEAGLRDLGHLD